MKSTYEPTMRGLAKATEDLEGELETVPPKARMLLMVAADEIFANIVRHSRATWWSLEVELNHNPRLVRLTFTDDGTPFDPLEARDPDTSMSVQHRDEGGLGILIVKRTMSPISYRREGGLNILTMCKSMD